MMTKRSEKIHQIDNPDFAAFGSVQSGNVQARVALMIVVP